MRQFEEIYWTANKVGGVGVKNDYLEFPKRL